MAEVTPFALTKLFSELFDRAVSVTDASDGASSDRRKAYGVYEIAGHGAQVFLQVDFELLGSMGGALAGIPNVLVQERLRANARDEGLRDAMYEVLNIASAVLVPEERAVLRSMELDETKGSAISRDIAVLKLSRIRFMVSIPSYVGGQMACYGPHI